MNGHTHLWAAAWRLHRAQLFVLIGIVAAAAAALIIFRWRLVSTYETYGCSLFDGINSCLDDQGFDVWWGHGFANWSNLARMSMLIGPVVLGAFAASPIFTREFSRGTHVVALTQSVSARQWFAVKTTIVAVPLALGLLALGYLMEWVDGTVGQTSHYILQRSNFFIHGPIPTATGLMAFGFAVAAGMITRNLMATLVVTIVGGGAILVGVSIAQPHLATPNRDVTQYAEIFAPVTQAELDQDRLTAEDPKPVDSQPDEEEFDRNVLFVGSGTLNAEGKPVTEPENMWRTCSESSHAAAERAAVAAGLIDAPNPIDAATPVGEDDYRMTAIYLNAHNRASLDCYTSHGIVAQYSDWLPGTALWPLRYAVGGILLALAALFTAAGLGLLPRAVTKR